MGLKDPSVEGALGAVFRGQNHGGLTGAMILLPNPEKCFDQNCQTLDETGNPRRSTKSCGFPGSGEMRGLLTIR